MKKLFTRKIESYPQVEVKYRKTIHRKIVYLSTIIAKVYKLTYYIVMGNHVNTSSHWVASVIGMLLDKRYQGQVPSLRCISEDMKLKIGSTLSHGQIRNILLGNGTNLTDRTRKILADFFDIPLIILYPPSDQDNRRITALTRIFAKVINFSPAQLAAVENAIDTIMTTNTAHVIEMVEN